LMSHHWDAGQNYNIKIVQILWECKFKYLGKTNRSKFVSWGNEEQIEFG
jgi:hypothetical protein